MSVRGGCKVGLGPSLSGSSVVFFTKPAVVSSLWKSRTFSLVPTKTLRFQLIASNPAFSTLNAMFSSVLCFVHKFHYVFSGELVNNLRYFRVVFSWVLGFGYSLILHFPCGTASVLQNKRQPKFMCPLIQKTRIASYSNQSLDLTFPKMLDPQNSFSSEVGGCERRLWSYWGGRKSLQCFSGDLNGEIPLAQNFEQAVFCHSNHLQASNCKIWCVLWWSGFWHKF